MEIVTFEDGDTNEDLIRKLKAADGPVHLRIDAKGGEVPTYELMELMMQKVMHTTLVNGAKVRTI